MFASDIAMSGCMLTFAVSVIAFCLWLTDLKNRTGTDSHGKPSVLHLLKFLVGLTAALFFPEFISHPQTNGAGPNELQACGRIVSAVWLLAVVFVGSSFCFQGKKGTEIKAHAELLFFLFGLNIFANLLMMMQSLHL